MTTPLWRNRDFVALWSGQVVSQLGAQISGTAMPLLVLATTGSPGDAGLVAAAGSLPFLVANLPAGPLVDRWNRHTVLLVSELTAAVAVVSVPIAVLAGALTVAHLAAVAFAVGLCSVFFGLAERAALPLVVPAGLLPAAIAQNEARTRGAGLIGPPLGGLLFAAGRAVPFLVDFASFLLSALALVLVRRDLKAPSPARPQNDAAAPAPAEPAAPAPAPADPAAGRSADRRESLWRATLDGLRWIWRQPLIRMTIALLAVSNLVFQALVLILVVLAHERGSASVGVLLGLYSAGGLAGALAATKLHRHLTARRVVVGVTWVWAALLPLFPFTTNPILLGVLGAACAFVGPLWNVVLTSCAAVLVPNHLLGRVTSAAMTVTWGVMPLASLIAGCLLTALPPHAAIWPLAALMLAAAIAATISPAVRHAPPLPSAGPQHPAAATGGAPPLPIDPAPVQRLRNGVPTVGDRDAGAPVGSTPP
ncbi:MFS transporter [Actinoplanes sp. KI2]|uniref:MFS transporter n=1 Tax=Actinoplanes sp. KI2 TaxID=2983315 RepID=UPI0021D58CD5|nr:MFS transporter [Actinoplanes sp. KI2]MCU7729245.1 MFS transporter [Actinoplanes sp. KI2]